MAQQALTQEQAESRLEALRSEISELQQSLTQSRERFANEQSQLRQIDLQIQGNALTLRELQKQQAEHENELKVLESDRASYLDSLGARKELLGEQIVSAYQLGRESRLKLLLNQDSPARMSRMLAYYDYFSRAQVEHIQDLRETLNTLDQLQIVIDGKLLELHEVQQVQELEILALQGRREQRQQVVSKIAGQIGSTEARLVELRRNREDLEALLSRLTRALADIPTDLGQYISPWEQRGTIPMPLKGRVINAFGQSRAGGLNWQGWLIGAESGSEVFSIAYGRVAYADWLRGYGLLMIIDHGEGIMSLYGNNESLLYEAGDWVQPGMVISTVGDSPGNDQGLYFELRNNGKAIDPATWISR